MEQHPLLKELLQLCDTQKIEPAEAFTTFEVYQELSEVRKLSDLEYFFSEELRLFYLSGKTETSDEHPSIYVPVMRNYEVTPQKLKSMQEILSPNQEQFYLFIRDRDSSSTCYCITKGLKKPDSPGTCKKKKELQAKKYQFERDIQNNRKLLFAKALKNQKSQK